MAEASLHAVDTQARRRYFVGTLLLFVVVTSWVGASFIMNSMFTTMDYNKPFLITYLCTSTFTLYLIRPLYSYLRRRSSGKETTIQGPYQVSAVKSTEPLDTLFEPVGSYHDSNGVLLIRPDFTFRTRSHSRSISRHRSRPASLICSDPPLTTSQTAALALAFTGLWFGANWAMNAALGFTSVTSTTILSSMSGFFTLGIGSCVGVENFTMRKAGSVIVSVLGVILVSKSDHEISGPSEPHRPSAPLLGDSLALASAVAYAFYVILLKVRIHNETRISMTLFFGFVGLFNIFGIWPLGMILHYTDVEKFELPSGGMLWASIAANAAITFVSDALYLRAMLMTSPLAVTLGMSLTIPLALIGDVYRGTELGGWQIYLGSACVLGSFLVNGFGDLKEVAEQELEAESDVLEGTIAIEHQRLLASVREVEFETEIETEERRSTDRIRT